MRESARERIVRFFEGRLQEFGAGPKGVDWNTEESQLLRFRKLIEVLDGNLASSVIDYGCGYGALLPYLRALGFSGNYQGIDISPKMLDLARRIPDGNSAWVNREDDLRVAEYVIASGTFNLKLDVPTAEWESHVHKSLDAMNDLARSGIACNFLSLYSDPDKRRPDLYYADPLAMFDRCKKMYGRYIALLHDYPLYEFTIIVRKAASK